MNRIDKGRGVGQHVTIHEVNNYQEFFDKIRKLINNQNFLYRGVYRDNHDLIPTIWRDSISSYYKSYLNKLEESNSEEEKFCKYIENLKNQPNKNSEMTIADFDVFKKSGLEWVKRIGLENYLLALFWEKSNTCGLNATLSSVPIRDKIVLLPEDRKRQLNTWLKLENSVYKKIYEFLKELVKYIIRNPSSYGKSDPRFIQYNTTIPRHHNLPCRLLDWSSSPEVALFFAAYGIYLNPKDIERKQFVVYVLDVKKEGNEISLIHENHVYYNKFLFQQQGVFTYDRCADVFFIKNGRWPTLSSDFLKREDFEIHKFIFNADSRRETIRYLENKGITYSRLLPSFSGVAAEINATFLCNLS